MEAEIEKEVTVESMVKKIVEREMNWRVVEGYITEVIKSMEKEELRSTRFHKMK